MAKTKTRSNTPAPATEEERAFSRECFFVKNGILHWHEERPDHHFSRNSGRKAWKKNWAGKPAGRADGRGFRASVAMNGRIINRSVSWFYEAVTGEEQPDQDESTAFGFSNLMTIMNKNLNAEMLT